MNTNEFVEYILGIEPKNILDLYAYADTNELIDIVYNIQKRKSKSIDVKLLHKLKKYNSLCVHKHSYLLNFFNKLNEENIKYCLVKGKTLSNYLYNDDSRFYKDIDIIVLEDDYRKFCKIAVENDFKNPFLGKNSSVFDEFNYYVNSKYDDVVFEKNIDGLNVIIEVKTHYRNLFDEKMNKYLFDNCVEYSGYKTLPIELMIVIIIYNCYFCYFTEYGIKHKFRLKQIIELHTLLNKFNNERNIKKIFQNHFDIEIYKSVMDFYNSIFYFKNKKILNLFDNYDLRINNFYKKIFGASKNFYPKLLTTNKFSFNNIGRFNKSIIRYFKCTKLKVTKINFDFFENENQMAFFIKFPRVLDNVILELIFIDDKYKEKRVNISK